MIITTTNNIDGYIIKQYCDIVRGTDIYIVGGLVGGGLINQEKLFGAAVSNATSKMMAKAQNKGADAIVGVQTCLTPAAASGSMIVVVSGTAVKIDLSDEQKALNEAKAIAKKEEEERIRKERMETAQALIGDKGEDSLIARFILECENMDSLVEMKSKWYSLGLDTIDQYKEYTEKLEKEVMVERMYGGSKQNAQTFIRTLDSFIQSQGS